MANDSYIVAILYGLLCMANDSYIVAILYGLLCIAKMQLYWTMLHNCVIFIGHSKCTFSFDLYLSFLHDLGEQVMRTIITFDVFVMPLVATITCRR